MLPILTVSFVIPSMNNGIGAVAADAFLRKLLDPIVTIPSNLESMTFIISTTNLAADQKPCAFFMALGQNVKDGVISNQAYNNYHMLRTLEEAFQLGTLGTHDSENKPILDLWK